MFIDNYLELCKAKDLKKNTAARLAGIKRGQVNNWESQGNIPKYDQLVELAKVLDCEVADFFIDFTRDHWKIGETGKSAYIIENDSPLTELIFIYNACSKSQRAKLMSVVYDFEEKVLNP